MSNQIQLVATSLYGFASGFFVLALGLVIYYYKISRVKDVLTYLLFLFFITIYCAACLLNVMTELSSQNAIFLIFLVSTSAALVSFLYFRLMNEFLKQRDSFVHKASYAFLLIAFICLNSGIWSLTLGPGVMLTPEPGSYESFFFARAFLYFSPSLFGNAVLASNSLLTLVLTLYLAIRYHREFRAEKLLFVGLIATSFLVIHDSIAGANDYADALPLIAFGFMPEVIRFTVVIFASNYHARKKMSQEFEQWIKRNQNIRLSTQFLHDFKRLSRSSNSDNQPDLTKTQTSTLVQTQTSLSDFYARIFSNKNQFTDDLPGFFEALENLYLDAFQQRGILFRVTMASPLQLQFPKNDLFVVCTNLIQNSLDHSPATSISITVVENPTTIEFIFEDNGGGIQPAIRNKMFLQGFSSSPKNSGAGLGLVRQAALENGCLFEYTGDLNQTQFTLFIPKV